MRLYRVNSTLSDTNFKIWLGIIYYLCWIRTHGLFIIVVYYFIESFINFDSTNTRVDDYYTKLRHEIDSRNNARNFANDKSVIDML